MRIRFLVGGTTAFGLVPCLLVRCCFGRPPGRAAPRQQTVNATRFVNLLVGDDIAIFDAQATFTSPQQLDVFSKPNIRNGIGLTSGIVLSSAWASEENGTNDNEYVFGRDDLRGNGYDAFDEMLPTGDISADACVLRIEFSCLRWQPYISVTFVYGTDDYAWDGTSSESKDMMGMFLSGQRSIESIASLKGRELTANGTRTLAPYKDNSFGWYQTEMNGFTEPITTVTSVPRGLHVLHIVVADTGKAKEASSRKRGAWLFLQAGSLTCGRRPYYDEILVDDDDLVTQPGFPTISPSPTTPPGSSPPQPPIEPSPSSPTVVPTGFTNPTTAQECATRVFNKCSRRCGNTSCYNARIATECEYYNVQDVPAYFRKVKQIILRTRC